jgi:hypothetical protein
MERLVVFLANTTHAWLGHCVGLFLNVYNVWKRARLGNPARSRTLDPSQPDFARSKRLLPNDGSNGPVWMLGAGPSLLRS